MTDDLTLRTRGGLPDALRVLMQTYPRDLWEGHANYDGLTRFWLERHLLFRDLLARIDGETRALIERSAEPGRAVQRTGRYAQVLLTQLHGHHQIEDHHYFPRLAALEPRLQRGFDILDRDHHDLDAYLHGLADAVNGLLRAGPGEQRDRAGDLDGVLTGFAGFLDRHLVDEEELIVPILLKHGAALDG